MDLVRNGKFHVIDQPHAKEPLQESADKNRFLEGMNRLVAMGQAQAQGLAGD